MMLHLRFPAAAQRAFSLGFRVLLPLGLIVHLSLPDGPGVLAADAGATILSPRRTVRAGHGLRCGRSRPPRTLQRTAQSYLAVEERERARLAAVTGPPMRAATPPRDAEGVLARQLSRNDRADEEHWPVHFNETRLARLERSPVTARGGPARWRAARPACVLPSGALDAATNPRRGLEQGLTLARPEFAPRARGGARVVFLKFDGSLDHELDERGEELTLLDHDGDPVCFIGGLEARDRTGRRVPVRFAMNRGRLRLELDDDEAQYPIRVQPRRVDEEEKKPEEERRLGEAKISPSEAPGGRPVADSQRGSVLAS